MKRIILLLAFFCISFSSSAQIQTKFWGLELSRRYLSLSQAKDIVSNKCKYVDIEENSIKAFDGFFGGYNWDFITFDFHKSTPVYSWTLYTTSFSSYHKNSEDAKRKYQLLQNSLTTKYGSPSLLERDDELLSSWAGAESRIYCLLKYEKGMSRGGDMYFYVTLNYIDRDVLDLSVQQQESEL